LFSEAGNATASPLAVPRNERCTKESEGGSGFWTRELPEEIVVHGGFVSHVFGSCAYSCDQEYPPSAPEAATS
jgi:hypothetical protein